MRLHKKTADWLITILWVLTISSMVLMSIAVNLSRQQEVSKPLALVHAMYSFDSPRELAQKQLTVRDMLSEGEWERLQLDNENRAINAYYKFKYSASQVHVAKSFGGGALYWLENENISASDRWLLLTEDNGEVITRVREYKLLWGGGSVAVDDVR